MKSVFVMKMVPGIQKIHVKITGKENAKRRITERSATMMEVTVSESITKIDSFCD